jgi:methionine biosynthesis protein MetW
MKNTALDYSDTGTRFRSISDLINGFDDRFQKLVEEIKVHIKKDDQVLDVGCGEGKIWQLFPDIKVTGLDISRENLHIAKKFIKPVFGDAQKLPFKNSQFNFILASEILEHVKEPDLVLNEISRVLKPEGTTIISFPNTGSLHFRLGILIWGRNPVLNYPENKIHIHFFNLADIRKMLINTGLKIIKVRGSNFLSFHPVNFGVYIPIPRKIRFAGGDMFPGLAQGYILTLRKKGIT